MQCDWRGALALSNAAQPQRIGRGVCTSEQRPPRMTRTVVLMQSNSALAATWILGAGLIGLLGNVTSIGGAATILGLGLIPPMLLMRQWSRRVPAVAHQANP